MMLLLIFAGVFGISFLGSFAVGGISNAIKNRRANKTASSEPADINNTEETQTLEKEPERQIDNSQKQTRGLSPSTRNVADVENEEVNDETVNEEEPKKEDNEVNKKLLEEYKKEISSNRTVTGATIDELIESKLDIMAAQDKLNPDTKENRKFVAQSLKNTWNNIAKSINNRIDSMLVEAETTNSYEGLVEKMPKITMGAWFDSLGCDVVVERTSEKFGIYAECVKDINKKMAN